MARGPELFPPELKCRETWQPSQRLGTAVWERIWKSCPKKNLSQSWEEPHINGVSQTLQWGIAWAPLRTAAYSGGGWRVSSSLRSCCWSHRGHGVLRAGGEHRGVYKAIGGLRSLQEKLCEKRGTELAAKLRVTQEATAVISSGVRLWLQGHLQLPR